MSPVGNLNLGVKIWHLASRKFGITFWSWNRIIWKINMDSLMGHHYLVRSSHVLFYLQYKKLKNKLNDWIVQCPSTIWPQWVRHIGAKSVKKVLCKSVTPDERCNFFISPITMVCFAELEGRGRGQTPHDILLYVEKQKVLWGFKKGFGSSKKVFF